MFLKLHFTKKFYNWFFFLILRLSILVDEFNDPFHPDTLVLNVYKSRLNHHIGKKHALIKYHSLALNASFAIEYTKKIMPKLIY